MTASPTAQRFPIRLGAKSRPLLLLFGVRDGNAYVDLDDEMDARFGFFRLRTPTSNILRWRIEGPWLWLTAIGVRRGIRHGDITFAGNHRGGVRLDFRERPRFLVFRPPALYLTVEDMEGFAAALAERGIPGEGARRRQDSMHDRARRPAAIDRQPAIDQCEDRQIEPVRVLERDLVT